MKKIFLRDRARIETGRPLPRGFLGERLMRALAAEAMAKADGLNREAEAMHERALQHALALDALKDGAP